MENPTNVPLLQNCQLHNQPILLYNQINNEPNCLVCLQEKTGMIPAETFQQKLKEIISKQNENFINNKKLYQNIYDPLLNCKNKLSMRLDKLLQTIQDQINIIDSHQSKILQFLQQTNIQQQALEQLQQSYSNQQQRSQQVKIQIKHLLDELQKKFLDSEQQPTAINKKPKIIIREQILDWKLVQCEIIQQPNIIKSNECVKVAFNRENSILVVACRKQIILYQFMNGVISQVLQKLAEHNDDISCLHFLKLSNSFITGSKDNSIIIWEFEGVQSKWFAKQTLIGHSEQIHCISMNINEDLLISGSSDKKVKFWKKVSDNWCCQQTINIKDYVSAISLNGLEDKLISCGLFHFITVLEKGSDNQWKIVQTINVSQRGDQLCFATEYQFVFQPVDGDQLEIYGYDQGQKQFQILQKVKIQHDDDILFTFPCQYIKQLKLIAIKHGQILNIFKINQTGDYQLIQPIDFKSYSFYCKLTEDGQYLVTWDGISKEIQVRKFLLSQ